MPLDPIPQLEEVEDVLDGLSSPTSLEVYEAILPFENDMVAAAIGKKTLEGGAGGPPSGNAGGDLAGSTYPNPVIANGAVTAAKVAADVATQAELDAHVNDAADAHDASAISILDTAADFTATDVEGALAELQSDHEADATALSDHIADAAGAHAATAVAFTPAGTIAATTVQAAIEEVASEAGGGGMAATLFDANTILKADSDDTPVALAMGASTTLARLASGSIVAATPAEMRTLLDVPTTGEAVLDTLFDANTVLAATSDNTPAAVTMGASTTLARLASGNIKAATVAEMQTLLGLGLVRLAAPTVLGSAQATFDTDTILGGAISGTYSHLRIVWMGATSNGTPAVVRLTFNNDGSSIYDFQESGAAAAVGSDVDGLAQAFVRVGAIPASVTTSNAGIGVIEIPWYTGTAFHKYLSAQTGYTIGTATGNVAIDTILGRWRSTAAVTRAALALSAGNWITGSSFAIYGVL